jgi:hypothetical protein
MIEVDLLVCPSFVQTANRFTISGRAGSLNNDRLELIQVITAEMVKARDRARKPNCSPKLTREVYEQTQLYEAAIHDLEKVEDLIRSAGRSLYYAEFAKFKSLLIEGGRAQ